MGGINPQQTRHFLNCADECTSHARAPSTHTSAPQMLHSTHHTECSIFGPTSKLVRRPEKSVHSPRNKNFGAPAVRSAEQLQMLNCCSLTLLERIERPCMTNAGLPSSSLRHKCDDASAYNIHVTLQSCPLSQCFGLPDASG